VIKLRRTYLAELWLPLSDPLSAWAAIVSLRSNLAETRQQGFGPGRHWFSKTLNAWPRWNLKIRAEWLGASPLSFARGGLLRTASPRMLSSGASHFADHSGKNVIYRNHRVTPTKTNRLAAIIVSLVFDQARFGFCQGIVALTSRRRPSWSCVSCSSSTRSAASSPFS
jgi:hypothetical protein